LVGPYHRQGIDTNATFTDLISFVATSGSTRPFSICNYPIWHGDSGSALIADIEGTKKIIGLCFAGSTTVGVACRIDHVADLIKVSAWKGESANFSNENIEQYTVNELSNQVSITISGKTYWQVGLINR